MAAIILADSSLSTVTTSSWQEPDSGAATCSRVRALVRFNPDGSTAVAFAHAILADDYGDPGLPNFQQGRPMADPTVVPRPRSAPECQTSPAPWVGFLPPTSSSSRLKHTKLWSTHFGTHWH